MLSWQTKYHSEGLSLKHRRLLELLKHSEHFSNKLHRNNQTNTHNLLRIGTMWFFTEKLLTNSSGNVEIRFFMIFTLGTEDIATGVTFFYYIVYIMYVVYFYYFRYEENKLFICEYIFCYLIWDFYFEMSMVVCNGWQAASFSVPVSKPAASTNVIHVRACGCLW